MYRRVASSIDRLLVLKINDDELNNSSQKLIFKRMILKSILKSIITLVIKSIN